MNPTVSPQGRRPDTLRIRGSNLRILGRRRRGGTPRVAKPSLYKSMNSSSLFVMIRNKLPILRGIAAKLFPGDVRVEIKTDPEIPNCRYPVFYASVRAEAASALRKEWYRRTNKILSGGAIRVGLILSVAK